MRRELFLKNWLVNRSGKEGHFTAGDFMEEHVNDGLQDMSERSDSSWDDSRQREAVAPNIMMMADLKNHWGAGVGLEPRRERHPEPHSRPEMRTLLALYKSEELHCFRAGRSYDLSADDTNTFARGYETLRTGKLEKWISTTTRARNVEALAAQTSNVFNLAELQRTSGRVAENAGSKDIGSGSEEDTEEEDEDQDGSKDGDADEIVAEDESGDADARLTAGQVVMVDGELVIEIMEDDDEGVGDVEDEGEDDDDDDEEER